MRRVAQGGWSARARARVKSVRPNAPARRAHVVIRTTPLGLVTGRDYYMSIVKAKTNAELQFELQGIIRSYNALYPVTVIADFVATRQAGRFERNDDDDES